MSGKEERIPFRVLSLRLREILFRIVLHPDACWKDVLIPLIPPPVDYFRNRRVIVEAFELRVWDSRSLVPVLLVALEWVVAGRVRGFRIS